MTISWNDSGISTPPNAPCNARAAIIATVLFLDRFVSTQEASRQCRTFPELRAAGDAPPVLYLWAKLSGRWLDAAGFDPGQRLRIEATHKRLVITPIDEPACDDAETRGASDGDAATKHPLPRNRAMAGDAQ
nr:SymE family type I addiction module toxin [Burkholderia pseudomultivorans]